MASKSIKIKFDVKGLMSVKILTKVKRFLGMTFATIALTNSSLALAQTDLEIIPYELDAGELSKPGYAIALSAQIINTDDVKIPMKALVTLDGKMQIILPSRVHLNEYDTPEYKFVIPAPVADLSYQFIAFPEGEGTLWSDRFYVSRSCLLYLDSSEDISDGLTGEDLIASLSTRSDAFDYEAGLYKQATTITKRLKSLIEQTIEKLARERAQ